MKKIIIVFIVCFVAILSTYIITKNKLSFETITESIEILSSQFSGEKQIEYSDEIKVNRLQMKKATINYNKLNDNQKVMYSAIANAVKDLKTLVSIDNYTDGDSDRISEDAKNVMVAFYFDHPEVFYLKLKYKIYVSKSLIYNRIKIELSYSVQDKNELELELQKIEKVIESYTSNLENKSIFEKELHIHDNLARDVKYYDDTETLEDVPEEYHSIYGTFIKKQAVCDGFAKAMQMLLDKVDIENIFITGMIDETPHAWNMVKFEDKWYHLDLTANKYVKELNGTTKIVAHTYFNVSDEYILKSHKIDNKELNPIANSNEYSFYTKTNSYISSTQNFDLRIKEIVQSQKASNSLEFASEISDVPNKLLKVLYDINFNGYKDSGTSVKMKYYNELYTYIVEKN